MAEDDTEIIPTMGEWDLIILGFIILIIGTVAIKQQELNFANS